MSNQPAIPSSFLEALNSDENQVHGANTGSQTGSHARSHGPSRENPRESPFSDYVGGEDNPEEVEFEEVDNPDEYYGAQDPFDAPLDDPYGGPFGDSAEDDSEEPEVIEAYLNDMEDGTFSEEDMEDLGELFVDMLKAGKDFLGKYFNKKFRQEIHATFREEDKHYLSLVRFCEQQEGKVNMQTLKSVLDTAKTHDSKYSKLEFPRLLEVATLYQDIRKDYEPTEIKPYQERGIKKYSVAAMRKYMGDFKPDPLAMLAVYLIITFAADGFKLWAIYQEDKRRANSDRE